MEDYAHAHKRGNEYRLSVGVEENGSIIEKVLQRERQPGLYIVGHIYTGGHAEHDHGYLEEQWISSFCGELNRPMML